MNTGIYEIRNRLTGDCYIGSTKASFRSRWLLHLSALRRNKHHSIKLQNAWNKYGEPAFEFVELLSCKPELVIELEQVHFDMCDPQYNIAKIAQSNAGIKRSPLTLSRMSAARMGEKNPQWRVDRSPETRAKLRAARLGKTMSEEQKNKIGEAMKGRTPWNKGKNYKHKPKANHE